MEVVINPIQNFKVEEDEEVPEDNHYLSLEEKRVQASIIKNFYTNKGTKRIKNIKLKLVEGEIDLYFDIGKFVNSQKEPTKDLPINKDLAYLTVSLPFNQENSVSEYQTDSKITTSAVYAIESYPFKSDKKWFDEVEIIDQVRLIPLFEKIGFRETANTILNSINEKMLENDEFTQCLIENLQETYFKEKETILKIKIENQTTTSVVGTLVSKSAIFSYENKRKLKTLLLENKFKKEDLVDISLTNSVKCNDLAVELKKFDLIMSLNQIGSAESKFRIPIKIKRIFSLNTLKNLILLGSIGLIVYFIVIFVISKVEKSNITYVSDFDEKDLKNNYGKKQDYKINDAHYYDYVINDAGNDKKHKNKESLKKYDSKKEKQPDNKQDSKRQYDKDPVNKEPPKQNESISDNVLNEDEDDDDESLSFFKVFNFENLMGLVVLVKEHYWIASLVLPLVYFIVSKVICFVCCCNRRENKSYDNREYNQKRYRF